MESSQGWSSVVASPSTSCYSYNSSRYSGSRSTDQTGGGGPYVDIPISSAAAPPQPLFDRPHATAGLLSPRQNPRQFEWPQRAGGVACDKFAGAGSNGASDEPSPHKSPFSSLPSRQGSFSRWPPADSKSGNSNNANVTVDFPTVSSISDICAIADSSGIDSQSSPHDDSKIAAAAAAAAAATASETSEMLLSIEQRLFQFESDGEDDLSDEDSLGQEAALGDSSACNVCGDVVAGFHCGAYVCEACKKFFVRCLKQDAGSKFTCSQNNDCIITKETRTQCPRCRYQKCLTLGMYRPGGPNLSSEICHIPCKVCGAPSSGFHFGAITCEGCKGFFRRSVKERDCLKYQCTRDGNCTITWKTRNVCKMCRYNQCLRAGMKPDKSRIGRQPNAVKHATFLKLCRIKSVKGLTSPTDPFPKFDASNDALADDGTDFISASGGGMIRKKRPYVRRKSLVQRHGDATERDRMATQDSLDNEDPQWQTIKQEAESPPLELTYDDENLILADATNAFDFPGSVIPDEYLQATMARRFSSKRSRNASMTFSVAPSSVDIYDYHVARREQGKRTPTDVQFISDRDLSSTDMPTTRGKTDDGCSSGGSLAGKDDAGMTSPDLVLVHGKPLPSYAETIAIMRRAYFDLVPILSKPPNMPSVTPDSTFQEVWGAQMHQFTHDAQATLKFAKKVPGFRGFAMEEQIQMVQLCMFPMVMVMLSLTYDMTTRRYNWFAFSEEERRIIFSNFEPFETLEGSLHNMGQVIQELEPDETEVSFLCALHLIDSGTQHVYKELLLDAFGQYVLDKTGDPGNCRQAHILMCLRDMADANECHKRSVDLLFSDPRYAGVQVPQLFKETFVGIPGHPNENDDDGDDVEQTAGQGDVTAE